MIDDQCCNSFIQQAVDISSTEKIIGLDLRSLPAHSASKVQ